MRVVEPVGLSVRAVIRAVVQSEQYVGMLYNAIPEEMKMPRLIQVIESEISRGKGTETNPMRRVTQYHTTDGVLLAERDAILFDVIANTLLERNKEGKAFGKMELMEACGEAAV